MIQLFDIKRKNNEQLRKDDKILEEYILESKQSKEELFKKYKTRENGLNKNVAKDRLRQYGYNIVIKNDKKSRLYFLFNSIKDKFILILLLLSLISYFLKDSLGSYIILGIAAISVLIRYFEDYSVYKFNQKLKSQIYSTTYVLRNKKTEEIKVENVVLGDIIKLNAGSIIPADVILIESKDLFVNQSVFTGESVPVEKMADSCDIDEKVIFSLPNICLMGSNVVSGSATAIVINVGFSTYLGMIGKGLDDKRELTNFEKGINNISKMLIKYMLIVSSIVLLIYGIIREDFMEAILFALSVAVGITPSMLPMIVNVNLTKGTKVLAKKKTLVKNINSIQNLGAIDILCTDKTGTLTEDRIVLQKYIDVNGDDDTSVLEYAYLNSYFGTGIRNIVDRAIISYGTENNMDKIVPKYTKIDEIPFDYSRKKMSIVVKNNETNKHKMITKGAVEEILKVCKKVLYEGKQKPLTPEIIEQVTIMAKDYASLGMQVIGLASKKQYRGVNIFNEKDESNMTFIGFVVFLDPPKKDVKDVLLKLKKAGIKIKILTGDNQYATANICKLAGIDNENIVQGVDIDNMTDKQLDKIIDKISVFARMNPLQKERVVKAYKKKGHVVGYMGDGVNDAPSLHAGDVGICVNTATDIAKEASDIILLEKDLNVIYDGVIEGRKVYGNIIKYLKMALSADFGDVFSIVIASIFLPFLPLLPIQMLIQDFLYDISQIAIPYDDVDEEFLEKPKKWDISGISRFMNIMGITSSITDIMAFAIFWFVFKYNASRPEYFQTAWFVQCLISETMIIHYVRTAKKPFIESRANKWLMLGTIATIIGTIITPILLSGIKTFHFVILPLKYYAVVILLLITYSLLVGIVKKKYIKKYKEWL